MVEETGCDYRVFDVTFLLPVSYRVMAGDEAEAVIMAKKAFVGKLLALTATGLPRGEPEVIEVGSNRIESDRSEVKEAADGRQE